MAANEAETNDTEMAKLNLRTDTDNDDDFFASNVETDLEENVAVIEDKFNSSYPLLCELINSICVQIK